MAQMTFPHYYENNNLFVPETSWNELKKDPNSTAFRDMVEAAKKAIREGGAFIVYRESDTAIMRRFDRSSELKTELDNLEA
jgi:hypothetical protein